MDKDLVVGFIKSASTVEKGVLDIEQFLELGK